MVVFAMTDDIGTPSQTIAARLGNRIGAAHVVHDDIAGIALAMADTALAKVVDLAGWQNQRDEHLDEWTLRQSIVRQVFEAAARGSAVVQGFCAPAVLREARHVLRVRICASIEERARSLVEQQRCADAATAVQMLRDVDASRAEFAKRVFNVDVDAAELHDVTINSDRLSVDDIVALLCDLAERKMRQPAAASLDSVVALLHETACDRSRLRVRPDEPNDRIPGVPARSRNTSAHRLQPTEAALARAEEALYGKLAYGVARADAGPTQTGIRPFGA